MNPLITKFLAKGDYAKLAGNAQLQKLVCDASQIPWGEGRTIEEVLDTKHVGTCTGKHLVLQACLDALKIPYRVVVCTFRWSEQNIQLPTELEEILKEGEWDHGHNFLQVLNDDKQWIDVDVTWDPQLKAYGFLTFPEDWDGNTSFIGLHSMIQRWDDADAEVKKQWINALTPEMKERREKFLHAFFTWIASLRSPAAPAHA